MLRPIDLQINVNRTADVGKIEQNNLQRHHNQQMQFAKELNKQVESEQQKIIKSNKSEHKKINADEERDKENRKKFADKDGKEKKKKDENNKKGGATSLFDIRV